MSYPIELRQLYLPYCVYALGKGRYIVLNRLYKPLGETAYVDYDTHPTARYIPKLTAAKIAKLSYKGEGKPNETFYFYNDGCVPTYGPAEWAAYAKRLAVFAKIETEVDDHV